jgi:hypothetical protein
MDKCKLDFDLKAYEMTRKRVRWITRKDGFVLYAREPEKKGWETEPIELARGRGPGEGVGRGGAAMLGYYLSGHGEPKTDTYVKLVGEYLTEYQQYFPDCHGCPSVGLQWMGLGLACGYPQGYRKVMDYHKAYFNLMRCYQPGRYVALPCRSDQCDLRFPYQLSSGTVGLMLAVKDQKLQITGAPLKPGRLGGCVEGSGPGVVLPKKKAPTKTAKAPTTKPVKVSDALVKEYVTKLGVKLGGILKEGTGVP